MFYKTFHPFDTSAPLSRTTPAPIPEPALRPLQDPPAARRPLGPVPADPDTESDDDPRPQWFGDDVTIGDDSDELLLGGPGNDRIWDGGGSDIIFGGLGNDVIQWTAAENRGEQDLVIGGLGVDLVQVNLERDDWLDPQFQAELADWLDLHRSLPLGNLTDPAFTFDSLGLTVLAVNGLVLKVDGDRMEPLDEAVTLADDEAIMQKTSPEVSGNLLDNDLVPDLVASVSLDELAQYGAVTLGADGSFTYVLDRDAPEVVALSGAALLEDSFTYTVVDADGDTATATAVVRIVSGDPAAATFGMALRGDGLGWTSAGAGDVNGDGIDDLVLAAVALGDPGGAYVFYGTDDGSLLSGYDLTGLDDSQAAVFLGPDPDSSAGMNVTGLGDVNGDGIDDVIVTDHNLQHPLSGANYAGGAYVVFGVAGGFAAPVDLGALDGNDGFFLAGDPDGYSEIGWFVSGAGDVNGDGLDDFIIGGSGGEDAYVVFGQAGGFNPLVETATLDGSDGFRIGGLSYSGEVALVGDINGDGIDDLMVGDEYGTYRGGAYVIFGGTAFDATIEIDALDGTDGFVISGATYSDDGLGSVLSAAGDFNGDGLDDMLVGAGSINLNTFAYDTGVYVVFGAVGDAPHGAEFSLRDLDGSNGLAFTGDAGPDRFVNSLAGLGDMNGDGIDDIGIGMADFAGGVSQADTLYLAFGSDQSFAAEVDLSAFDGTDGYVIETDSPYLAGQMKLAGAGDINADGIADLVISTENPQADEALSLVIFGGADNLAEYDAADGVVDGHIALELLIPDTFLF